MTILVTGAAGFIGFHISRKLLSRGLDVVGIDNLNDYYDVNLKKSRLEELKKYDNFSFQKINIADRSAMENFAALHNNDVTHVIHLAAQAGVRYSIENPFAYLESNLCGHLIILEMCRNLPNLKHLVYASSSSVYGNSKVIPFAPEDPVNAPISLYAATKKADELMTHSYSHLYNIPATGIRFFTVYGSWGRPDMAYFLFTKAILEGKPIRIFNHGKMQRDFTYIDDVVSGLLSLIEKSPFKKNSAPHNIYNIGNNKTVSLMHFLKILENVIGRKAEIIMENMQAGDVERTYADIEKSQKDFNYHPKITVEKGLPEFVKWYRDYYKI